MAKCDEGYRCQVCGEPVKNLTVSSLYLLFVIGELPARELLSARDAHLRCNPELSQFILDEGFPPLPCPGPFDKRELSPAAAASREALVSRGYRRLKEVSGRQISLAEYPLPEFRTPRGAATRP